MLVQVFRRFMSVVTGITAPYYVCDFAGIFFSSGCKVVEFLPHLSKLLYQLAESVLLSDGKYLRRSTSIQEDFNIVLSK